MRDEKAVTTAEVADAMKALEDARGAYDGAVSASRDACSHETSCRNRLNDAQKRLDALLERLKESSPRDTAWGERHRRGLLVASA